jgi:hypothetical protein
MLEKVAPGKLLERVKDVYDDSIAYDREWQNNAQEAFGFRDGWAQWSSEEKDILAEERRPALTLNIVKSHIDLVKGLNEDIKKRYVAQPVGVEDSFLCEVINNVVYWLYQKNDFESEEDTAYESALISGRGWIAMDYDINENNMSEIKLTMRNIPVHEVRYDPASRKNDLSDASYIIHDKWLSLEDFVIKYPKFESKAREAFDVNVWPTYQLLDNLTPESGEFLNHDINDESDYSDPLDVSYFDSKKKQMRVCHMEYWKYVKKYHVYGVQNGKLQPVNIPWKEFQAGYEKAFPGRPLRYETSTVKEVWWLQFCGEEILYHGKSPIKYPGFSIVPCFLFGDVSRRKGYHYGMVELMKDPQREINKRTSQTLNLFNQQVQPGVYAEARAFANIDQAEQSLREAGSLTILQDGAIGQQRFMERTVPAFPSAVLQMGEYAREMIRHITGINPDLLGMNDKRQEAGIVVQLRQQQGMSILKPVFKAYNTMKEEVFKRLVAIVMTHLPSDQIMKILGEPGRYQIAKGVITDTKTGLVANIRDAQNAAYDIDTEPESNNMTQNALELATFMEMGKNGIPMDPKVIIGKTNLNVSEKIRWIEYIEGMQKSESEAAERELQSKEEEATRKHELELRKLDLQMAIATRKADDQREKDILKAGIDQEKLDLQKVRDEQTAQIKGVQVMTQARLGAQKEKREWVNMMMDADIDKKRLMLDIAEVMANSEMQGKTEAVKATIEMYKLALDDKKMTKENELKFATAVMDAYTKMDIEGAKLEVEKQKIAAGVATSAIGEAGKAREGDKQREAGDKDRAAAKDSEKLKAGAEKQKGDKDRASTEKMAKDSQSAAGKEGDKNRKSTEKMAKDASDQKKKDKPL